jgi:hypothetical protein
VLRVWCWNTQCSQCGVKGQVMRSGNLASSLSSPNDLGLVSYNLNQHTTLEPPQQSTPPNWYVFFNSSSNHPLPSVASSVRPPSSGSSTIRTRYVKALACHARDCISMFSGRSRPAASSCLIRALMFKRPFWPARGQNVAFAPALLESPASVVARVSNPILQSQLQP